MQRNAKGKTDFDWKLLFSGTILSRGRKYYEQRYVVDYKEKAESINASVLGSRIYDVKITDPGKSSIRMRCSCPHARDGFNCKHMAAVLFKWEDSPERGAAAEQLPELKEIIPPAVKGEEPFYHIWGILSGEQIRKQTCIEAKAHYQKGRIRLRGIDRVDSYSMYINDDGGDAPARISGSFTSDNDDYVFPMQIRLTRKEIKEFECRACGKHREAYYYSYTQNAPLCEHLLALLIEADEYTKRIDPGDYTDRKGQRFLDSFMDEKLHKVSAEQTEMSGGVRLEPRLVRSGSEIELNFRIGNAGKMYIVRNLTELHKIAGSRGKMYLGKKCTIDFASEHFDEASAALYELIEGEVRRMSAAEEKLHSRRALYYTGSLEAGKGIPFTGAAADTIYDQFEGSVIDYKDPDGNGSGKLMLRESDPKVRVAIHIERGEEKNKRRSIKSINVSGSLPFTIDGVRSRYFISDGFLSRLNEETWSRIRPFADAAQDDDTFDFSIGHKHASRFYYEILPQLREDPAFIIDEMDTAEGLIHEKAEFAFYLDAENDIISCEAEVSYGTETDRMRQLSDEELPLAPHREIYQEMPVYELLHELFDYYDPALEEYWLEDSDDARFELLKHGVPRLMAYGEVSSTDRLSAINIRKTPSIQLGVSVESDLLNLDVMTQDMSYEELAALMQSYRQRKKYHRLKGGEYIDLSENESLDTLMSMMESAGADVRDFVKGKIQIPAYRALYLDKMLEGHEELVAGRDRHYRNLIRNFKTIGDAEYDIPAAMDGVLRAYQDYGYRWLRTLETAGFGGILADDMGLGKTLEILTLLEAYRTSDEQEGGLTALVVCPASVVYNWIEEIHRFAPEMVPKAVAGSKAERRRILDNYRECDILVTSYDLLKRDIDMYEELSFSHMILDEAQYIKNAKAVAAKSVKLVRASHRFALTGTPIENRLSELWSIFDFLMPGFLYGYEQFRKSFELPISKYGDKASTENLKNMISPFILRRKKNDVLKDLPDKIEEVRYAHMEEKQRKVYDGQAVRISKLIEEKGDFNTGKIEILAELTRIRQICCDPDLLFRDYEGGSAKREACIDLLSSAVDGGHKILLFSQFTSMLALLEEDLQREGISYYKLTGETSKEERMRLVRAFNSDDTSVFLISLKAGGTGLNLTGADIVIHYDPWWNLAAQDQATDRAHRIGQTKDVTVFKLIAKDTIEEKIMKLQETKKELADSVLSGETRSLGSMTKEELLALL